jgi:spermidine synthase
MEDMAKLFMINSLGYFDESAPLQRSSTRYQIDECVACEKTPFAETVIVKSADYGTMLFLDNELQSTSYDEKIYHETLVHPIMNVFSAVENKHILVIGGAEGATVREVLKWDSIKMVEWVDIDNRLVDLCKTHLQYTPAAVYDDSRLFHFGDDIMHHLALVEEPLYDIIIIDLPDPDPEMGTPLYGPEFWERMRKALKPGGGMVTHTGPVEPGFGRQVGMKMVQDGVGNVGHPYHSMIPSFQGEWGFWMNIVPSRIDSFPASCEIMNLDYQKTIFHWDKHWQVNFSQ